MSQAMTEDKILDELEETLRVNLREYAQEKEASDLLEAQRRALLDVVINTPEYKKLQEDCRVSADKISALHNKIDEISLEYFDKTGNKHPVGAITIQERTTFEYDESDAIDFCIKHFKGGLKLDKTMFERYVRAVQASNPVNCVKIIFVKKVTVASDLSDYR